MVKFLQVKSGLDTLLFNLLVLGVLESSSGQVWRRRPSDLYVIEVTTGQSTNGTIERRLPITKVSIAVNFTERDLEGIADLLFCLTA